MKDKRRTKNNNLEFLIGWCGFPDLKDDTWEPLDHLSGPEHKIREFNEQWEKDYVRKTTETLQAQTDRRKSVSEKNAQRDDIDEVMGEGGGDEEVEVILSRIGWALETCAENFPCHQRMTVSNLYAKTSGRTWRWIGGSQI